MWRRVAPVTTKPPVQPAQPVQDVQPAQHVQHVATEVAPPAVAIPSSSPLAAAAPLEHANVSGTLPSDAPLAAKAPPITAPPPAGPLSVPPPPPAQDEAKPRES